jgi:hypothetical protein
MSDQAIQKSIQDLAAKNAELKEVKRLMKEHEKDVPMELEDILLSLKDLKKQAKGLQDDHLRNLLEESVEYGEYREQVQFLKEEIAQAKLELFTAAENQSREHGDLDKTVTVEGAPHRLQTQKEMIVYLDGRVVK